jgi:hypothetical protein
MSSMEAERPRLPTHIHWRRLPAKQREEPRVRSLSWPTSGCTTRPETGPASHATQSAHGGSPSSGSRGRALAY